jgi:hypothetical protein
MYLVCHPNFLQEAQLFIQEVKLNPGLIDADRRRYLHLPLMTDTSFRLFGIGVRFLDDTDKVSP